uniref:Uncharacterized protein n=1 Tax=Anguilla anguilla TaxID=7936 RepID=A0A0E9REQ8_ANGAN
MFTLLIRKEGEETVDREHWFDDRFPGKEDEWPVCPFRVWCRGLFPHEASILDGHCLCKADAIG